MLDRLMHGGAKATFICDEFLLHFIAYVCYAWNNLSLSIIILFIYFWMREYIMFVCLIIYYKEILNFLILMKISQLFD